MNNDTSEVEKFFNTLPSEDKKEADVFGDNAKKEEPKSEPKVEKPEADDEPRKNRYQRRMEKRLQEERESNILLAERLRALTETDAAVKENPATDARLIRIFGTTDEGKELAKHFTELLKETKESAREEALRELSEYEAEAQTREKQEIEEAENQIDSGLEAIEDAYGVDLTSNSDKAAKQRREFLELVEKLSPKDSDGTITDYADFDSTWEIYQATHQEKMDNSRSKEIASRSMQRSGSSTPKRTITPGFRGWEKDFNID